MQFFQRKPASGLVCCFPQEFLFSPYARTERNVAKHLSYILGRLHLQWIRENASNVLSGLKAHHVKGMQPVLQVRAWLLMQTSPAVVFARRLSYSAEILHWQLPALSLPLCCQSNWVSLEKEIAWDCITFLEYRLQALAAMQSTTPLTRVSNVDW